MKVYSFSYYERWGAGQGIVIAESIEDAITMMLEPSLPEDRNVEKLFPQLEFYEINITEPQFLDFSWRE